MPNKILARMHSAEHIFCKALIKENPYLKLKKIKLDETESSVYFDGQLTWNNLFKAEKQVNEIIKEGREIIEHSTTKEDVHKIFPEIRIKLDRIIGNKVRVIEVKDFDFSACSGEHCKNTKEIKNFLVTKLKSTGSNRYEVKFKVDVIEDLYKLSTFARKTANILGTEYDKIEATLTNLKKDLEKFKKLSRDTKIEPEIEIINNIKLKYKLIEIEPKQLIKLAQNLRGNRTVIVLINKTEKSNQILIMFSADLNQDASKYFQKLTIKFGGKGGGNQFLAQGSIETDKFDKVFNFIKELLNQIL
ncbi:MAG: DHHA1 domain-containing protein [Nanoarchaeota archaeon]|nr:DHHA1 domain-containing protein [Nanoarchaeota archaeon]